MLEVGGEIGRTFLLSTLGGYVVFPIILSLITLLIILKFFPDFLKKDKDRRVRSYYLWIVIAIYGAVFGVMSILRYLSIHNTVVDFGGLDYSIWNIAKRGDFKYIGLGYGHFSPVLIVYALFYKLYSSGLILLVAQTITICLSAVPLYYIARDKLKSSYYALLIVIIYFLYSPVQYNNLFDFHTDHLLILLMFLAFYFLEKKNALAFILVSLSALFLKEPLILSVAMLGLYAVISRKMYKSGSLVFIGNLFFFFMVIGVIMSGTSGASYGGGFEGSFSYLGGDVFQIIKTLISDPRILIKEAINAWKMAYIVFPFLPLLFIPFFAPLPLLVALPALIISLLSRLPTYYWIQNHYTASLIAPIFVSLIYGLSFLGNRPRYLNRWSKKLSSLNLTRNGMLKISLWSILVVSLYYNIILSPSPISVFFWKRIGNYSYYYRSSYVIQERDRVLDRAIKEFIPEEASVSSQGSLTTSYLAHRTEYYLFPDRIGEVDYVVLDRKRDHYVGDGIDEERYKIEFERLLNTYETIFSHDGIYIFGRKEL